MLLFSTHEYTIERERVRERSTRTWYEVTKKKEKEKKERQRRSPSADKQSVQIFTIISIHFEFVRVVPLTQ